MLKQDPDPEQSGGGQSREVSAGAPTDSLAISRCLRVGLNAPSRQDAFAYRMPC
jgi:hypothetical protein